MEIKKKKKKKKKKENKKEQKIEWDILQTCYNIDNKMCVFVCVCLRVLRIRNTRGIIDFSSSTRFATTVIVVYYALQNFKHTQQQQQPKLREFVFC